MHSNLHWETDINISAPPGGDGPLPSWDQLKFNPLGIYNLRRRLGAFPTEPGIFTAYKSRFEAADVAWFAAGLSVDGKHELPKDSFHPLFIESRQDLPQLTFDLATLWDRAFGGFTMVVHVDGTSVPGTPTLPEYIKNQVYLPPALLKEMPDAHNSICDIIQIFTEKIGVPTTMRWTRAARNLGWSLTQKGYPYALSTSSIQATIPAPFPSYSSHYTFHGRPYGTRVIAPSPIGDTNQPPAIPPSSGPFFGNADTKARTLNNSSLETIAELNVELAEARKRENYYERCIASLRTELSILKESSQLGPRVSNNFSTTPLSTPTSLDYTLQGLSLSSTVPDGPRSTRWEGSGLASPTRAFNNSQGHFYTPTPTPRIPANTAARAWDPESAKNAYRPPPTDQALGPAVDKFLTVNGLTSLGSTISVIKRLVLPSRWEKEVRNLNLSRELTDELVEAMSRDLELK
ncbi:hypothetical protein BD779DRAFT_1678569 [Infundibulicybe gibba]|nr:hypothetical protein BD779DRAFT_1678569 [Infundibulicybe gibba]